CSAHSCGDSRPRLPAPRGARRSFAMVPATLSLIEKQVAVPGTIDRGPGATAHVAGSPSCVIGKVGTVTGQVRPVPDPKSSGAGSLCSIADHCVHVREPNDSAAGSVGSVVGKPDHVAGSVDTIGGRE